ncbi:MAG: hypothetical protein MUC48_26450 [Leptolyngbya sp. Prado105]|nr:hypothetical protein [Leptolyngbya sp. Prado105]
MKRSSRHLAFQIWMVLLVILLVAIAVTRLISEYNPALIAGLVRSNSSTESQCVEIIDPNALLNRNQILKLISLAEPSRRAKVRAILKAPYCKLEAIAIRAGAKSEQEAYLLEYDPTLWAMILYEGNEFIGVRIAPRNSSCPTPQT